MNSSTRIIVNTLSSYARLCILAMVGIVATPIILRTLGPIDFGIFSVIGGSLAFLMFINGALTTSAQRHIAFALGKGSQEEVAKWFTASLMVHLALGLVIAAIALGVSDLVLHHFLVIPPNRLATAAWLYKLVILTMVSNIVSTPFQALLVAHESLVAISLISILSALATLAGALSLRHLPGDSLLWYAVLYCTSQLILFLGPALYCAIEYPESRRIARGVRAADIRELLSFSGWNLFGSLAAVIRWQGPALVINKFVGPAANASYGLSIQVNGFASEISWGLMRAMSSPIVKRRGAGDAKGMAELSNLANKFSFLILWVVLAPVLFETHFCLTVWLRHVPPLTEMFVQLLLTSLLIDQLTAGFGASLQATGRIAAYQVVVGTLNCIAVPIGYVLVRFGQPPSAILWAGVGGAIAAGLGRLWFAQERAGISALDWLKSVLWPAAACTVIPGAIAFGISHTMSAGLLRFVLSALSTTLSSAILLWFFGITGEHRAQSIQLFKNLLSRVTKSPTPLQSA